MSNQTELTITGNLTDDPTLRYTKSDTAVSNFTVAATPRVFNSKENEWEDGDTLFLRCTAWGPLAEHAAASLTKGSRVIAVGTLGPNNWEDDEGETHYSIELTVSDLAPSLRWATAEVEKDVPEKKASVKKTSRSKTSSAKSSRTTRSRTAKKQSDEPPF